MQAMRRLIMELMNRDIRCPLILTAYSGENTIDEQLIHFSTEAGALLLDGMGDGIWLKSDPDHGRQYAGQRPHLPGNKE
jgi:(E)-4-hydroxy-3-methylbut-2-enyl-diphosphate synthase